MARQSTDENEGLVYDRRQFLRGTAGVVGGAGLASLLPDVVHGDEEQGKQYALIVACTAENDGGSLFFSSKELVLEAVEDAKKYLALMGFRPSNIHLLLDQRRTTLDDKIKELSGKVKPDDIFFFTAPGHGIDGKDSGIEIYNDKRFTQDIVRDYELKDMMSKIPSERKIRFMGNCNSGTFAEERALRELVFTACRIGQKVSGKVLVKNMSWFDKREFQFYGNHYGLFLRYMANNGGFAGKSLNQVYSMAHDFAQMYADEFDKRFGGQNDGQNPRIGYGRGVVDFEKRRPIKDESIYKDKDHSIPYDGYKRIADQNWKVQADFERGHNDWWLKNIAPEPRQLPMR